MLFIVIGSSGARADTDLATAIASKAIHIQFLGTGGSSGDSIIAKVRLRDEYRESSLDISVAPGTQLLSNTGGAQNMVVARLQGRVTGAIQYEETPTIHATHTEQTYLRPATSI
jgi:hypothetical protein